MDKELEKDEIKILKSKIAKLTLEGKLRKDLGNELERQRKLALDAKNELHLLTDKLSKYLAPQLYNILFQVILSSFVHNNSTQKKAGHMTGFSTIVLPNVICAIRSHSD